MVSVQLGKNSEPEIVIFLHNLNIYFGCSKEPSHRMVLFEYSQHMFLLRSKKGGGERGA